MSPRTDVFTSQQLKQELVERPLNREMQSGAWACRCIDDGTTGPRCVATTKVPQSQPANDWDRPRRYRHQFLNAGSVRAPCVSKFHQCADGGTQMLVVTLGWS